MKKGILKQCMMLAVVCFAFVLFGVSAKAAEEPIGYSATKELSPVLTIGQEYYTVTNGLGYVSFRTPNQAGYLEIDYKNISIDAWAYAIVTSGSGNQLASDEVL